MARGFCSVFHPKISTDAFQHTVGYIDKQFTTGTGPNDGVGDILPQADGKILIGGVFTHYNGIARSAIARLYNCLTPQPDSIYGLDHALCSGSLQAYHIAPVPGASKYEWTLPGGWTGTSDSTSIIATSDGNGGTISVRAFTDSCGYSYATERTILTVQPPGVNVCLVTVDDSSTHNIIIWEKPATATIDSFFIYRETTTNVNTKIASIPYDSLSQYHDYDANPNATSYRYKLSVIDTCGAESALRPYHNTIHLQNLGSGNFQWTFYEIENSPNPVISFNVYRDNLGNGNFAQIGTVPGTNSTFTDINYFSFPDAAYVVDVNWGIGCTPTRVVNTTRSNIRRGNSIAVGMEENPEAGIEVYPNPAENLINISFPFPERIKNLRLINMLGKVLWTGPFSPAINISALAKGVYLLEAETENSIINKKVIVQ